MSEIHFVSSELSCGIGILHKVVDFSWVVGCYVVRIVGKKCLFEGEKLGNRKSRCAKCIKGCESGISESYNWIVWYRL